MDQLVAPFETSSDHLREALLASRSRWRDFGAIAADFVFEVDCEGRFSFVSPEMVLGWRAESLLGRRAAELFFRGTPALPDPFLLNLGMRQRRVWLRGPDGKQICAALSSSPLLDDDGDCIGARVAGTDITAREHRELMAAAALRRAEVMDHLLDQMRQEVLAPRIMAAMLEALLRALGGQGVAVVDLREPPEITAIMHSAGERPDGFLDELLPLLRDRSARPQYLTVADTTRVIACHASTRFGHQAALAIWRPVRERAWDADDRQLVASVTALVRIVLEHEAIQRELARQARTDPLTGLLNRRAFIEEARRRIDRLEQEGLPGTLMFVDLDRLKPLNDRLGHEAGDSALVLASTVLRGMVRPSDLVARLGGDEFALWLDEFDGLTAAERAEHLRLNFPREAAHLTQGEPTGLTMSIGIACRQPGTGEELDDVIQRADQAMYEVKRAGGGHWRVSNPERVP